MAGVNGPWPMTWDQCGLSTTTSRTLGPEPAGKVVMSNGRCRQLTVSRPLAGYWPPPLLATIKASNSALHTALEHRFFEDPEPTLQLVVVENQRRDKPYYVIIETTGQDD